jgi:tRNA dimethylallyltransferase
MSSATPLVVVVGPTAAGKSDLALAIAGWFDGEVVSADAFQVYRGLDIGTAKADAEARRRVPHHCIDIADPDDHYTAGRYACDAAAAIADVHARGRIAVVAGGSGFYIRALVDGLAALPGYDERWRTALETVEQRRGAGFTFGMLEALDPDWAAAIGPADRQRTLRGIEVTLRSGRPMSTMLEERGWSGPRYQAEWMALTWPRLLLYRRIEARVDGMLRRGWLEEVRGLLAAGYSSDAPGLRAIGYRELVAHLQGQTTLEAAREQIIRATRKYAKRQLTWFRGQTPAVWYELQGDGEASRERLYERVRGQLRAKLTC